jgi:hypothetical protein
MDYCGVVMVAIVLQDPVDEAKCEEGMNPEAKTMGEVSTHFRIWCVCMFAAIIV